MSNTAMYSEECDEYRKYHKNCKGCPYEPECREIAERAFKKAERLIEIVTRILNNLQAEKDQESDQET